jgi:anti-anti-sigma factor
MLVHSHFLDSPAVGVLELGGEVDVYTRAELRKALEPLTDAEIAIVDLSQLRYSDLSLINGLMHLRNRMSAKREPVVRLVGVSPQLKRIFELIQLAQAFEFYDSRDGALNAFAQPSQEVPQ